MRTRRVFIRIRKEVKLEFLPEPVLFSLTRLLTYNLHAFEAEKETVCVWVGVRALADLSALS